MNKPPQAPPPPEEDDWRLHAVTRLADDWKSPWTGEVAPRGSRLTLSATLRLPNKKTLTIPLPNATALFLSSAAKSYSAAKALRDQAGFDRSLHKEVSFGTDAMVFDYLEHMLSATVLAFTAVEAFVNEVIPDNYVYARQRRRQTILEATTKSDIERFVPLDEKLATVLPEAFKCPSPKGSRCWQQYQQLKDIRDRVVHMKTDDRKSSGPDVETVWKAILLTPAPHRLAKPIMDFFVKVMPSKPGWHKSFPRE
jgi:hypothetical protein